jgi:hypothetical protein
MQGTVYSIRCKETGEQYIGSTCKHAEYRLEQHRQKNNKTCSRAIIDRNNYELVILEAVICDNKKELLYRERHYIESEPKVVNKSRPVITEEERKKAVLDYEHAHKEYYKAYRDAHKDKWMAPYSCHCGITCSLINKNRHERSIQHKDRVANLISNSFAILVDEC